MTRTPMMTPLEAGLLVPSEVGDVVPPVCCHSRSAIEHDVRSVLHPGEKDSPAMKLGSTTSHPPSTNEKEQLIDTC